MAVSYNKLWKLLIDRKMKKKDLREMARISPSSIAKMGRNGSVTTEVLEKICTALQCDVGDIMEMLTETHISTNTWGVNMINEKFGFDKAIVAALQDTDSIPTTEPNAIPGVPGRLYIVAPEQKEQLKKIIGVLDNVPQSEIQNMTNEEKMFYSSLLKNADRVLNNCISRPTKNRRTQDVER